MNLQQWMKCSSFHGKWMPFHWMKWKQPWIFKQCWCLILSRRCWGLVLLCVFSSCSLEFCGLMCFEPHTVNPIDWPGNWKVLWFRISCPLVQVLMCTIAELIKLVILLINIISLLFMVWKCILLISNFFFLN